MYPLGIPWLTWYGGLAAFVALVLLALRRWSFTTRLVGVAAVAGWSYACWLGAGKIVQSMTDSGYHFAITSDRLEGPSAQAGLATGIFLVPVILAPFVLAVRAELRQMDAEAQQAAEQRTASSVVSLEKPAHAPAGESSPQVQSVDTAGTEQVIPRK